MIERLKTNKKWIGIVLLVIVGAILFSQAGLQHDLLHFIKHDLRIWLDTHPYLAPFIYMILYVVFVICFMPGTVLTVVGGAVFGLIWGSIYTSVASTVGAGGAFLVARYIGGDWIEEYSGERMNKLQKGIEEDGWKVVAVSRLIPFFPYNLLNYMFGLTRINFWTYILLTWLCMIPGTIAYVYVGYAIGVTISGKDTPTFLNQFYLISTAIGVLLLVSVVPRWFNTSGIEAE